MSMSRSLIPRIGAVTVLSAALVGGGYLPAGATAVVVPTANMKIPGPSILNNGKFALPASDKGTFSLNNGQGQSFPGWLVGGPGDSLQVYSLGFESPPGATYMVKLGGANITQAVKTTPGLTYLLQWYESGYPNYGPPWIKTVDVIWGGKLVAAPTFNAQPNTNANMRWALRQEIVTATSTRTTLEFADVPHGPSIGFSAMMGNASLAGDAKLYLPSSTTLPPTGTLVAIVHTATGYAFSAPGLTLELYGTWKEKAESYAPPTVVTKLIASGTVLNGQVTLRLHLPTSLIGKTVAGVAVLSGSEFIPVKHSLTIKVS
jgi:hypothetical protein